MRRLLKFVIAGALLAAPLVAVLGDVAAEAGGSLQWAKTVAIDINVRHTKFPATISVTVDHGSHWSEGQASYIRSYQLVTLRVRRPGMYRVTIPVTKIVRAASVYPSKADGRNGMASIGVDAVSLPGEAGMTDAGENKHVNVLISSSTVKPTVFNLTKWANWFKQS